MCVRSFPNLSFFVLLIGFPLYNIHFYYILRVSSGNGLSCWNLSFSKNYFSFWSGSPTKGIRVGNVKCMIPITLQITSNLNLYTGTIPGWKIAHLVALSNCDVFRTVNFLHSISSQWICFSDVLHRGYRAKRMSLLKNKCHEGQVSCILAMERTTAA